MSIIFVNKESITNKTPSQTSMITRLIDYLFYKISATLSYETLIFNLFMNFVIVIKNSTNVSQSTDTSTDSNVKSNGSPPCTGSASVIENGVTWFASTWKGPIFDVTRSSPDTI